MNKNRKLINALLVSTMMISGLSLDVSAADGKNVERIGGDTRIQTAIKASDKAYPSKADAVVVAGWNGQVDALTGTLLASAKDAPLLMVSDKDADIESVKAQIAKLGAKTVYLLGGESAVSAKVANALDVEGVTIDRVSGKGRFATAVEVAKRSETTSTHAFITADGRNGTRLADALSAGPAAGVKNSPILLTSRDSLPEETKAALKDMGIKSVTVVGGTAAVSNDVLEALQADLGKANVGRVYGAGRIETALEIAEEFFPGAKNAVIANDGRSTNENYADALVGGYFGAKMKAPVLLTQPGALSEDVKNFLGTNSSFAYVLGATGVVSKDVETEADVAIDKKEEELKVESVSPINAKTLEVTFNQEVDTEKANVEVVKSTIKQNVSKRNWAADNKSVQLEMSAKLMKGDYTVNVKGLTDEVLTKTVTVEDERVESIEILSDIAVVNNTAAPTSATVGYQVKNQYGEDITKTTSLTTNNTGNITASNGVVTLNSTVLGAQAKVGDKVAVALVHAESAKSATKVVTLSAAASVSELQIKSLYNKDGKELNEATNLANDKFYLIIEAKDQYGNILTNRTNVEAGLIKSESNPTVVGTAGAGTSVTLSDLTIDGKKVLGLEIKAPGAGIKAGESVVTLISTTTGKNASYKVVVAETTRADVVNLSSPALAVQNEDILVPVAVIDKDGNAITDVKVLNSAKGATVTFGGTQIATPFTQDKDGNVFIKIPAGNNSAATTVALVAQSSTLKVATLTIKVEPAAVAKTVRGLKNPLILTTTGSTKTKNLSIDDIVVEDQYGRVMSTDKLKNALGTTKGILIENVDASATAGTPTAAVTLAGGDQTATSPAYNPQGNTISDRSGWQTVTLTGAAKGSSTFKLVLVDTDGKNPVLASTAETTVRVTDGKEYTGYEIAPIGKVQAKGVDSAGDKAFTVNGVLNSGKVALGTDDYTATISGGVDADKALLSPTGTPDVATVTGGNITVETKHLKEDSNGNKIDTEFTLKVTINATGDVLEQKFIVSADARKVEDYFFTTAAEGSTAAAYTAAEAAKVTKIDKLTSGSEAKTAGLNGITVATIDQYGNKEVVALAAQHKVTIVPEDITKVNVTDNGTAKAKATLVTLGTEANVTLKIQIGNAVKEIKAVVK